MKDSRAVKSVVRAMLVGGIAVPYLAAKLFGLDHWLGLTIGVLVSLWLEWEFISTEAEKGPQSL